MGMGRRGGRVLALFGASGLALGSVLASPALAASTPPGWIDPGGNGWVGFTLSDSSPDPVGRTGYEPVTVQRATNLSGTALRDAFSNWETLDTDATPGVDTWRWPTVWEAAGVRLERVDACDYTADSCRYAVVTAGTFWFFGGTPPTDPVTGLPNPNPADFEQTISLAPLPTIHIGTLDAVGTAGVDGAAGTIHLSAAGTVDEANLGPLTYKWVLVGPRGKIYTTEGPNDFFDVTAEVDGIYCVELTVTASDGYSVATPTCAAGGSTFSITGVAPAKTPAPAPAPSGGGGTGGTGGGTSGTGGGTGGTGGGIPGIGFSNPARRAPSSLTGGGGGASPTVIWLWRPEWFQPAPPANELPRTDGQPEVAGRTVIEVRRPVPRGASAGPWLAGVGIFGLLGGSWVISRRRRLRMLAEL